MIQHGTKRDAHVSFCLLYQLILLEESITKKSTMVPTKNDINPFETILLIAPDFNYRTDYKKDEDVYPYDAVWNTTKVRFVHLLSF